MTTNETIGEITKERREAEALWVIGKKGFFDHGAIDDSAIRCVIRVLAPTHDQEETFAVIERGLQPENLRTSVAFGWGDVAEIVSEIYAEFQQQQSS